MAFIGKNVYGSVSNLLKPRMPPKYADSSFGWPTFPSSFIGNPHSIPILTRNGVPWTILYCVKTQGAINRNIFKQEVHIFAFDSARQPYRSAFTCETKRIFIAVVWVCSFISLVCHFIVSSVFSPTRNKSTTCACTFTLTLWCISNFERVIKPDAESSQKHQVLPNGC